MATRVNTKFVFILAVTLLAATGIVGGLWVLHVRGDTTRHIRAGDELMALGEYERALKEYGRAVSKKPSNLSHLQKVEEALLSLRPATRDQASEYDGMRIEILRHRTRYRPHDADTHLEFVEELHRMARWFARVETWQEVADAADEMWRRVPPSDPKRAYGQLYRGLARTRMLSARTATQQEVEKAERDLREFVEAVPDSDLGWASLVAAEMSIARQLRLDGNTRRAAEKHRQLEETIRRAADAVPDGPEMARMVALHLSVQRVDGVADVSDEELAEAMSRMVELVTPTDEPMLLAEASELVRSMDQRHGLERAIELLGGYVEANPDQHYQRYMLAMLHFANRDFDAAREAANVVIQAEPVPVSLLSRIQYFLRMRAASLIVDVEYRQWEVAEDEDKPSQLERVRAARDHLASLVGESENEPLLLKADGKIAIAKRDYPTAAAKFERLIKLQALSGDSETLWNAALALEQVGQVGLALERLRQAAVLQPQNPVLLAEKARLEYRVGQYDRALSTVDQVLELRPNFEAAKRIQIAIEAATTATTDEDTSDPVARALLNADSAAQEGDLETARTILVEALADEPESLPLLGEIVRVELRRGQTDAAREYLERALALQPNNQFLRKLDASLSTPDQIEALKEYMASLYDGEAERTIHTIMHLEALAAEMGRLAQRRAEEGDGKEAEEMRASAERARAEIERLRARADEMAPGHPVLLEHLFKRALADDDWDRLRELVDRAQRVNADQAGGLIFKGRYELATKDYEAAVRSLTEATARKHYSSLAWRLLGRAHEHLGNFNEATRAYRQAYDCNPNDKFAVRWYVNLLMQTGEKTRAVRVLRNARHALADDYLLREARLQLEAEVGDLVEAMEERRRIYEESPENRLNAVRLAALLGRSKPTYECLRDEDGEPKYDAERWAVLPVEDREGLLNELGGKWVQESEKILNTIESDGDDTVELITLRADLSRARGEIEAGERILQAYIDSREEPTAVAFIALSNYQAEVNQLEDAIETLQSAREHQSAEGREVDRALGDLYFDHSLFGEAYDIYSQLHETGLIQRSNLRLVECATKLRRFADAETLLREVVEANGPDYFTMMLSATIAAGRGDELYQQQKFQEAETKYAEELDALNRAERLLPSSPMPDVRRSQRLVREFRQTGRMILLDDALRQLERADEKQAGAEATSIVRVDILRSMGDVRGAIGELSRLLERWPDHAAARRLLIQLYVEAGSHDAAMVAATEAIKRNPTVALWHEMKGDLHVLRRDVPLAVAEFKEAFRYQRNTPRLVKLVETSLALNEPDYEQVAELIAASDDLLEGSPFLRGYYALALNGAEQRDHALEQMRVAYADLRRFIEQSPAARAGLVTWFRTLQSIYVDGKPAELEQFVRELCQDNPDAQELQWIARSWVVGDPDGGLSRAIELAEAAREKCGPGDVGLRAELALDIGQYKVRTGDYRSALTSFEEAIELNPVQTLALNNAAYIYAEHLGEPERAIPYAARALQTKPDDPFILDTLGWAHYKAGSYAEAEEYLRRAVEVGPSADNHLHLASVLARTDRPRKAEIYLRRAAELNPGDEAQAQIDELADEIKSQVNR